MSWLRRMTQSQTLWVLALWALAVAGRLMRHGTSFGLDYRLFQPDGGRYLGLTSGLIQGDLSDVNRLTLTRPFYSVLSVPFYAVLGDQGMLVVPALSLLTVGVCILLIARREGIAWAGVAAFAAISFSVTVNRWMIADITDSPHTALFAVACVLLHRQARTRWILLMLILGLLTRPAGPAWMALFLPFMFLDARRTRLVWWWMQGLAALVTLLTLAFVPDVSGIEAGGPVSMGERVLRFPQRLVSIPVVEFGQLAVLDRTLLAFVAGATVLAFKARRDVWSHAHFAVLGTTLILGAWNGVYGVNFRYQLPALIPAAVVWVRWAATRLQRHKGAEDE